MNKYMLGQVVWFIKNEKVQCEPVTGILLERGNRVVYNFGSLAIASDAGRYGNWLIDEGDVYATKEELLRSI